jgi:hypothetical protein
VLSFASPNSYRQIHLHKIQKSALLSNEAISSSNDAIAQFPFPATLFISHRMYYNPVKNPGIDGSPVLWQKKDIKVAFLPRLSRTLE